MLSSKRSLLRAQVLAFFLATLASLHADEAPEMRGLREKALRGNAVAQFNLGCQYADMSSPNGDRAEAFVWFRLAADNGATGKELAKLLDEMSPAELTEGRKRLEERRLQLVAAPKEEAPAVDLVAAPAPAPAPVAEVLTPAAAPSLNSNYITLQAEKERIEKQLAEAQDQIRKTGEMQDLLGRAQRDISLLQTQNEKLGAELRKIQMSVPAGEDPAMVREKLAALEKQLAAMSERAVAAEARLAALPLPAAADSTDSESLKRQLAETEGKLNTSLRSYILLQAELEQAHASSSKSLGESEARLTGLQTELDATKAQLQNATADAQERGKAMADIQPELNRLNQMAAAQGVELTALRDQLRQTLEQLGAVTEDNRQLRTRQVLAGASPSSSLGVPVRPGSSQAAQVSKPVEPLVVPPVVVQPRQHIIAEGDTLSRISRKYYGTADRWQSIFDANRKILSDPSLLPKGAALTIP